MNSSHLKERIPAQLSHVSNVPPKWKSHATADANAGDR
jgi:hypothetical protein